MQVKYLGSLSLSSFSHYLMLFKIVLLKHGGVFLTDTYPSHSWGLPLEHTWSPVKAPRIAGCRAELSAAMGATLHLGTGSAQTLAAGMVRKRSLQNSCEK